MQRSGNMVPLGSCSSFSWLRPGGDEAEWNQVTALWAMLLSLGFHQKVMGKVGGGGGGDEIRLSF